MEKEVWKDIKGYEGFYKASNLGHIFSVKRNIILKGGINSDGYYTVMLFKNGIGKSYKVHRLIAETFIFNKKNLPQINHINGNKIDNRVENLEFVTSKENIKHAWEHKLAKGKYGKYGNRAVKIIQLDLNNKEIKKYNSIMEAEKQTNISHTAISNCLKNLSKTSGGFKWKYQKL